jgi:hypothetical protein
VHYAETQPLEANELNMETNPSLPEPWLQLDNPRGEALPEMHNWKGNTP